MHTRTRLIDVKTIKKMVLAGMNIARINMSHGDFKSHRQLVRNLREAAGELDAHLTILADLPWTKDKDRLLAQEPFDLKPGDYITLTTEDIVGSPPECRSLSKGFLTLSNQGTLYSLMTALFSWK